MAEIMECNMCKRYVKVRELLIKKKIEEACSVQKNKELSSRPNANSAGESGDFTESCNGNELP